MKNLSQTLKTQKGFTLIELIVVIGILGILIVALLAALDPLEQIRKGRDSGRKTLARELHGAITRYYASHGVMPWQETNVTLPNCGAATATLATTNAAGTGAGVWGCITALGSTGAQELKAQFETTLQNLFVSGATGGLYVTGTASEVTVCFDPESRTESLNNTPGSGARNTSAGAETCTPGTSGAGVLTCQICVK